MRVVLLVIVLALLLAGCTQPSAPAPLQPPAPAPAPAPAPQPAPTPVKPANFCTTAEECAAKDLTRPECVGSWQCVDNRCLFKCRVWVPPAPQPEPTPQPPIEPTQMTLEEARSIATNSECTQEGSLTDQAFYNEVTHTWWIDLDLKKPGCAPACVVSAKTRSAEINWRCTGLLP